MTSISHLSESQRQTLANTLQDQLLVLKRQNTSYLQGLSLTEHAQQTRSQDADDATQRAGDYEVEEMVLEIDHNEFEAVSSALQRIHNADYGLCVDCHSNIPFKRLAVEPQALRCVTCQTLQERKM
jgi:RNA polymerase-binding transcription factor DksA